MTNTAKYAKKVAEHCDTYNNQLYTNVVNKSSAVPVSPEGVTDRLSIAMDYVKAKKAHLKEKSTKYENLSTNIDNLVTNAKIADSNVAKAVNNSREKFLQKHINLQGDGWCAFFANLVVDVPILGKIAETIGNIVEGTKDLLTNLKYWYEICGGKQIIDTALAIGGLVLATIGAIVAIIGLTLTGPIWGVIVSIAAAAGGIIALVNAIVNISYTLKANKEEDPAWSQYYRGFDKASDFLRKKTFKTKFLNKFSGTLATTLDVLETVCGIITLGSGIANLYGRSGLNSLFGNSIGKNVSGNHKYIFNASKFKQTISSKSGWTEIGFRLRHNWKYLVFGNPNQDGFWKAKGKRYSRAWKKSVPIKRIGALGKLVKGDLGKINSTVNLGKMGIEFASGGFHFSGKDTYSATKMIYGGIERGGMISLGTSAYDGIADIKKIFKNNQSYKNVITNMSSID